MSKKDKIKVVDGHGFFGPMGLKTEHIGLNGASKAFCGVNIGPMNRLFGDVIEMVRVCPKCLRHANSWEPVKEVDEQEEVESKPECHQKPECSCPGCTKMRSEKQHQYMVDQYKMICDMYTMPYEEGDCDTTAYDQSRMYLYINNELRAEVERIMEELKNARSVNKVISSQVKDAANHVKELIKEKKELQSQLTAAKEENERRLKKNVELSHELVRLKDAVNGHTIENIREIMTAAPPAEDLEGYKLKYGTVYEKEEFWHVGYLRFQKFDLGPTPSSMPALVRTHIVEHEEIPQGVFVVEKETKYLWCGKIVSLSRGTYCVQGESCFSFYNKMPMAELVEVSE
jgi:hypothetical protein